MLDLCSLTPEELGQWLVTAGEKSFRAKQIFEWVYEKGAVTWDEMTNVSKELREKLSQEFRFPTLERVRCVDSNDGETFKTLWRLSDGMMVESVLICSGDRRTVCVSSQVGCPAKCAFCASGKNGFFRNLSPAEIIEQVLLTHNELQKKGERVSHIVFMGMGEPMENYDAVVKTIRLLAQPGLLNISQRRITVSTVGVIEGIQKLALEEFKVNLVLSLHAPTQQLRKKIIPYARRYDLEDVLKAMDNYTAITKRDITYEYTLLAGINDTIECAELLVQLLRNKQCTVNLIPYNPVDGLNLKRPAREVIEAFRQILDDARIVNTCRYTKGDDIGAACGQLALQQIGSV